MNSLSRFCPSAAHEGKRWLHFRHQKGLATATIRILLLSRRGRDAGFSAPTLDGRKKKTALRDPCRTSPSAPLLTGAISLPSGRPVLLVPVITLLETQRGEGSATVDHQAVIATVTDLHRSGQCSPLPGERQKQGRTSISDGRLCFACGRNV